MAFRWAGERPSATSLVKQLLKKELHAEETEEDAVARLRAARLGRVLPDFSQAKREQASRRSPDAEKIVSGTKRVRRTGFGLRGPRSMNIMAGFGDKKREMLKRGPGMPHKGKVVV